MNKSDLVVVTGAGGFIGGHLVAKLLSLGFSNVRAVDIKPATQWFQKFEQADNRQLDLMERRSCDEAVRGADQIFNLASNMGGIGFIENNKAACMISVLINSHLLLAARETEVQRFFFASSACVYAAAKQRDPCVAGLREEDAYPAEPEDGYGWEKLFSERMCRHFSHDFGLSTRVARYHNVYGSHGIFGGEREKAPAAICRKVIAAKLSGRRQIEIWGDGQQTRSFMYIEDCIKGTLLIMNSDHSEPLNLGSDRSVTVNRLVDIVEEIAGIRLQRRYRPDAPQGVRGRNSDNTRVESILGWKPQISLEEGLERTYRWIYDQMMANTGA